MSCNISNKSLSNDSQNTDLGQQRNEETTGAYTDIQRKAEIRWSEFPDGEGTAPRSLSMFIIEPLKSKAGLQPQLNTRQEAGLTNLSMIHLQAMDIPREKSYGGHFNTLSTFALNPEEGCAIPLSLTLGRLCNAHGAGPLKFLTWPCS